MKQILSDGDDDVKPGAHGAAPGAAAAPPGPPGLLPHHLAELRASGLDDATLAANGVYSESDPAAVAGLLNWGAARARSLGPVLVYPHHDRDGRPLGHATVKPDRPRDRADKPGKVKYENPRGRPNRLYVPAGARPALADPAVGLVITEGCKKALAATQHGFPCVSLPGVWSWVADREKRGGRKVGRLELNADLAAVAWRGRRVYITFDSDAARNPDVGRAERALAAVLRRHGADVRVVRLPAEPDGGKNGLDDFLVRHGPDAFRRLVEAAAPPAPADRVPPAEPAGYTDSGYTVIRGGTYHCVRGLDPETGEQVVEKQVKLANFVARIVGETVTDDGAEPTREFAVTAERPGRPPATAGVPVERFGSLDWVVERFGPGYVIQPGSGRRDHLRCAVQEMSGDDIPLTTVYAHTGWREVGGAWHYLHAGGAVGPAAAAVRVRLDGAAAGFVLPDPPAGGDLRAAVRASLGLLDGLAPDTVVFPLLATVYRAPLGPADYALWLAGLTGANKSELAALAQQHFGAGMTRTRLPGNWSSTGNALEGLAFAVKDAVLVVDDFAPSSSRPDADRQHGTAERLIRGTGNAAGRLRMRADGMLRPPKPPRALVVATGEDVPRGHSITARLCVLTLRRGAVDLARLSACQRDAAAGRYAAAMAGYLGWLAPQYAAVRAMFEPERVELRDRFVGRFPHARTPDIVANLLLGLRRLLDFAAAAGVIDAAGQAALWARGEVAFRAVAADQGEHQRAADPVERFPEVVAAVVSSGRGFLAGGDGREPGLPPAPEAWGWERREFRAGDDARATFHPRGRKIGWVAGDVLYLDPDATYAAVVELARDQGQAYPLTQQTLYRRLKEAGVLLRTDGDRTGYPVMLEGTRRRVLHVAVGTVFPRPGRPGHSGRGGDSPVAFVPGSCPGPAADDSEPGHEPGTESGGAAGVVPAVPVVPGSGVGGAGRAAGWQESPADDAEVFTP
jgi:hypothetical protein